MKRLALLISAPILLGGCVGSLVPETDLALVAPAVLAMPLLAEMPTGATIVGTAEGWSCKNKAWHPEPTRLVAENQMRVRASEMRATAIVGSRYDHQGVTLSPNCWSSIRATGTAVILAGRD